MRLLIVNFVGIVLTACHPSSSTPSREPRHFVIGLSPYTAAESRRATQEQTLLFLMNRTVPGDRIDIINAFDLKTIASVTIPRSSGYENANARTRFLADLIAKTKGFLDAAASSEPDVPPSRIRLPQFAEFCGNQVFQKDDGLPDVLIPIGSVLYYDSRETAWNMVQGTGETGRGFWPSDRHIAIAPNESVYGTLGRENLLKGIAVHFAQLDSAYQGEMHRVGLDRFYHMYFGALGASLDSFSPDLTITYERAANGAKAATPPPVPDEKDLVPRMVTATWLEDQPQRTTPSPSPQSFSGLARIGIRWKGEGNPNTPRVDLDLYVKVPGASRELFFNQTTATLPGGSQGWFYRDIRSGGGLDLEFVELPRVADIREVETWVNFYGGESSGPVEGELRLDFGGRVYSADFIIHARKGNGGLDRTGDRSSAHWVKIDLRVVLGSQQIAG